MLAGALDFECNIIQPYQLRLTKDEKVLDYFPQRGKATWVGTNKWFKIDNIENFLETNFK